MEPLVRAARFIRHAGRQLSRNWTAKRVIVLILLAIISEYILTDLQTTALSIEGINRMVESVNFSGEIVVTGILQGTIWLRPDHVSDLIVSLGILAGACAVLILLKKEKHIRLVFILYNIFLLFWIVYNVLLMVASLWSQQGVAILHLTDAALIWLFCILSFGIFYWVIDAELQEECPENPAARINYLFPQTANKITGWENWKPGLFDYIFLSFTISTSFGPTDTMVLSKKAKFLLMFQAIISLVIIMAVAAWAISNI